MNDQEKSREQLIAELVELRQRVAGERATPELKTAAALFQVAPLGIHECDTEGRITFVNPSQEAITGYPADELVGTYLWDRVAPGPEKDSLPAYFKHLVAEQPAPTPFFAKNTRKSGEVFDVRIDWNYIRNVQGEVTGFVSVVSDITEHKRAEDALARNKAILQAAIESLPFDFFALGPDGRYLLQNATSRSHWNEAIGKRPEELGLSEGTLSLWLDNNRRAFAGEKVEGEVGFLVHGESRFFRNVIAPIRDDQEVIGILGVNIDITNRRRAEQELQEANERLEFRVLERTAELTAANERLQAEVQQRRQAEEQVRIFRRFAEAATQGFGMADIGGQLTYVNPFLARLFGAQKPEDVIGKHVSTYYPADYLLRREREIIPALRCREHWQGEQRMIFPDGQMHPTIHSIFPVHDENGTLLCTAAVITDITEVRRAEDALRQSYEELRSIHECMVDGLLIADIETKGFVKTNRAICEMLGYR